MLEPIGSVMVSLLYILAYLVTACTYVFWNELLTAASSLTVFCLSSPSSPILLSMIKLHCLVLACFVLAACFQVANADDVQHVVQGSSAMNYTFRFDDLTTSGDGFGIILGAYHHLNFAGLYPFNPHADALKGRISQHDLNCAVSAPNALYGARYQSSCSGLRNVHGETHQVVPAIHVDTNPSAASRLKPYFTLHSLKIKPLDIPLSYTTLHIKGHTSQQTLLWQVDFPLGFHDMLHVKMEEFSKQKWEYLEKLELFADLHYDGGDWEFCLDDMAIEFARY